MFYKQLMQALDDLPEKELITGSFFDGACFCAVGAMRRLAKKENRDPPPGNIHTAKTITVNDEFKGTNEERFTHVYDWAKSQ